MKKKMLTADDTVRMSEICSKLHIKNKKQHCLHHSHSVVLLVVIEKNFALL